MMRRCSALAGVSLALAIACDGPSAPALPPDGSGTTTALTLRPIQTASTTAMVRDSGFPAMFVNRTAVAITLQGGGCGERQALYERWTGSGWQTISGLPNPCGVPASPVGAGDSTLTGGGAQLLVPGSYRLRLGTTGGAAISPVVVLR